MERNKEMQSFAARFNTFQIAHQLSKRRASSQASGKKKAGGGNTIEWPHERPSGEELARAGFYYRPAQDSADNVQCFLCGVKLDGWEAEDDPLTEHMAHSASCPWAMTLQAGRSAQSPDSQEEFLLDPSSEELVAARRGTFETGAGWPHESKRGWKCKVSKMVEAGWCFDPAPPASAGEEEEEGDGVTCFYCNLSLDGWEPKDDPREEHRRRSPGCAFFALVERFGVPTEKKGKRGGKKAGVRTSMASKASRLSTQSVQSMFSEAPSSADIGGAGLDEVEDGVDDSIVTTASQAATTTSTTKGKKKGAKPKAVAKGAKGRKRANTVESQVEAEPMYPDLNPQIQSQPMEEEETFSAPRSQQFETSAPPTKQTRKGTRASKAPQIDSSIVEISSLDAAQPPKKATRGRKAKGQPEPEPESNWEVEGDDSEVSAQLQEELERSIDLDPPVEEKNEAPPQPDSTKPKRGIKRTSAGVQKKQESDDDVSGVIVEFPVPPKPAPAPKAKRGRKPSKQIAEGIQIEDFGQAPVSTTQEDVPRSSEMEVEVVLPSKAKKATAPVTKGKGKKARNPSTARSSRSSRSSKTTTLPQDPEPEPEHHHSQNEPEDLERDEREIEAELERIAAEQAAVVGAEQENLAEYEPSPSNSRKINQTPRLTEDGELQTEEKVVEVVAGSPPQQTPVLQDKDKHKHNSVTPSPSPSPNGSDKENQPSSTINIIPSAKQVAAVPILSPTKTTRLPLAPFPGTPNRSLHLSPSKHLSHLTSTRPWLPTDLEDVLGSYITSPDPTPAAAGGGGGAVLPSPEKELTVEAWVRFRAAKAEEQLRRRCEVLVGGLETEGLRALGCLEGVGVGGLDG